MMNLELLILDGPQAGRRLPVGHSPAIIGRSSGADISFPLDNFISGRHVSIQADPRGVLVNDLRSTNGTFLNGERMTQAVAGVGDLLKIGSMTVRVVDVEPSASPLSPPPSVWGDAAALETPSLSALPATLIQSPSAYPPPMPVSAPASATSFSLPPMEIPAPPLSPAPGVPVVPIPAFHAEPVAWSAEPLLTPPASPVLAELTNPLAATAPPVDSGATKLISSLNFSAAPPSPSQKTLAGVRQQNEAVLANLRDASGPLFCLLHAGADETIPAMLALADVSLVEHCLLEGEGMTTPSRWAPYLLPLTPEAPLLRLLVEKGWGKGWGSFFTSFAPFEEVRGHFRKFLMVQVANGGEPYFRFYEPKVLREFLVAGSATELAMFFGPIDEWLLEAESKTALLKARNSADGLTTTLVPLTAGTALPEDVRAI